MDGDIDPFIQAFLLWASERSAGVSEPDAPSNELIRLRHEKLDGAARGAASIPSAPAIRSVTGPATLQARLGAATEERAAGAGPGQPGRPRRGPAPPRQDVLRASDGPDGSDPALRAGRPARRRLSALHRARSGRLHRRHRRHDAHADWRAHGGGQGVRRSWPSRCGRCRRSGTASRTWRRATASATSTSSSTPTSREIFLLRSRIIQAIRGLPRRPRLPRGRDADDAADPGRGHRPAVQDAPQRPRHASLPAHRARALPQAPGRGRLRARLRDQPQLPQRGRVHAATIPSSRCWSSTRPTPTTTI